jgi:hypothetical protein
MRVTTDRTGETPAGRRNGRKVIEVAPRGPEAAWKSARKKWVNGVANTHPRLSGGSRNVKSRDGQTGHGNGTGARLVADWQGRSNWPCFHGTGGQARNAPKGLR